MAHIQEVFGFLGGQRGGLLVALLGGGELAVGGLGLAQKAPDLRVFVILLNEFRQQGCGILGHFLIKRKLGAAHDVLRILRFEFNGQFEGALGGSVVPGVHRGHAQNILHVGVGGRGGGGEAGPGLKGVKPLGGFIFVAGEQEIFGGGQVIVEGVGTQRGGGKSDGQCGGERQWQGLVHACSKSGNACILRHGGGDGKAAVGRGGVLVFRGYDFGVACFWPQSRWPEACSRGATTELLARLRQTVKPGRGGACGGDT